MIKNRSSLGQEMLDFLGILSMKNYTTASINFDKVIDAFAEKRLDIFFFFNYENFLKKYLHSNIFFIHY
jgi:hypothetical protein